MPGRPCIGPPQASVSYLALMVTLKVLLGVFVSVPLNDAWPVEVKAPAAGTPTFTVIIMVCPAATVVALHVMVPALPTAGVLQLPVEVESVLNGSPAGNVSVKITAFAAWFCAFLICQVKVSVVVGPEAGPPFCAEPVTCKSVVVDGAVIAVLNVAVLFTGTGSGKGFPAASFAFTVAVLVIADVTLKITVTVALPPETIPPRLHWN